MSTEPVLAARPWLHRRSRRITERDGNLTVKVLYDPQDLYSGWLDKLSWQITAVAHLRKRNDPATNTRVASPQLFPDGMRFALYDGLSAEPDRIVEIVGGYAVDQRTGERMVIRKNSNNATWEKCE